MVQQREITRITNDEFIALWINTIRPGQRDDAIKTVIGAENHDEYADIYIDSRHMITVMPIDVKRKWVSRERGHVYKLYDNLDLDEPGVLWTTEHRLIDYLIEQDAPFRAITIEYLSNKIGKTIEIIAVENPDIN